MVAGPAVLGLLIVHEQALLRAGVRRLLAETPQVVVVADVATAADAVGLDLTPDVVLAGCALTDAQDEGVVLALRERFPAAPVIVIGPAEQLDLVHAVIAAGASGYLSTTAMFDELLLAVRSVARGEPFLQPSMGIAVARWRADRTRAKEQLSAKERDILQLIALGHTNREIASRLEISLRTVETHRSSLGRKLGFRDRASLVNYAFREGIVS